MHGTLDNLSWTTERVDQLKLLAAARYSASQIGRELKITRNAVIGKANRIGVQINSPSPRNARTRRERPPSQPKPARTHRFVSRPRAVAPAIEFIPFAPEPLNKTLVELNSKDCRFIVTADSPFLFCGHPQDGDSSYCSHHHFVVVQQ